MDKYLVMVNGRTVDNDNTKRGADLKARARARLDQLIIQTLRSHPMFDKYIVLVNGNVVDGDNTKRGADLKARSRARLDQLITMRDDITAFIKGEQGDFMGKRPTYRPILRTPVIAREVSRYEVGDNVITVKVAQP